jgi:prephenate dehydrogenase
MINTLAIIGVGLIGGSLARDLRALGLVREIIGYGRSLGNLQLAVELGVIDRVAVNARDAVMGADLIVIAVPVGSIGAVLQEIAPAIGEAAVVTDVGSVKQSVIGAARSALGARFASFVPGHPIAGTENSGVGASLEGLFRGRRVILTPTPQTDTGAAAHVHGLWQAVGAQVISMDPLEHDRILAASSHLPHMVAYALMDMLVRMDEHREIFEYSAGGLHDTTRVAGSDGVMWRDIVLANREALLAVLRQYHDDVGEMIDAIERGDGQWLLETFQRARRGREMLTKP